MTGYFWFVEGSTAEIDLQIGIAQSLLRIVDAEVKLLGPIDFGQLQLFGDNVVHVRFEVWNESLIEPSGVGSHVGESSFNHDFKNAPKGTSGGTTQ